MLLNEHVAIKQCSQQNTFQTNILQQKQIATKTHSQHKLTTAQKNRQKFT
jgi:hypothetical protein